MTGRRPSNCVTILGMDRGWLDPAQIGEDMTTQAPRKNQRGNIVSGYVPDYVRTYSANRRPDFEYFARRTSQGGK